MAETNINVTPGSGGPNIDLETVDNGNARQVICIGDPTSSGKVAPVDSVNGLTVNMANPPAGAATSANQTNGNQTTQIVDNAGHNLNIDPSGTARVNVVTPATFPISAASLPLPTLAATSTKQSDGTQKTQIVDGAGDVALISASGALSVDINAVGVNALGQEPMAASLPVVIASDQTPVPSKRGDVAANRTRLVLNADAIASVASEAMMTFQSYKAGVVTTGLTSYTVTAGKTLKIQCIKVKIRPATPSTTVTFASTTLRLREGALITSPLIDSFPILMQTNNDSNPTAIVIPEGLEFPAGTVLGMSHVASATTILEHFSIIGYEY
jgi:hypothetical protein